MALGIRCERASHWPSHARQLHPELHYVAMPQEKEVKAETTARRGRS